MRHLKIFKTSTFLESLCILEPTLPESRLTTSSKQSELHISQWWNNIYTLTIYFGLESTKFSINTTMSFLDQIIDINTTLNLLVIPQGVYMSIHISKAHKVYQITSNSFPPSRRCYEFELNIILSYHNRKLLMRSQITRELTQYINNFILWSRCQSSKWNCKTQNRILTQDARIFYFTVLKYDTKWLTKCFGPS